MDKSELHQQPDLESSPSCGLRVILVLFVCALFFLAGIGVDKLLAMPHPGSESPEVSFARAMSAHHGQAVTMALMIRERSTDETLRTFALDLILTQQAQIGQMQGWLNVWGYPLAGREPPMKGHTHMMGMATQAQINTLQTLPILEAEKQFLRLMISHHQGGVRMAQQVLERTTHPAVKRLANSIVASQQSEIITLQELLDQRQ